MTDLVPVSITARSLLRRIDPRIAALRRALSHSHADEAFWAAFGKPAHEAQSDRAILRMVANLLHVERAATRGRLHGTRFATLEDQQAWLAQMVWRQCPRAARLCGVPENATLIKLRIGELLDLPPPSKAP